MTNADAQMRAPRSTFGWIGVLTGPIAWISQLIGSWAVGEIVACSPGNRSTGRVLGLDANAFVGIVNGALLAITALAGLGAFLELRATRAAADRSPAGRATWLATAGVLTSVLFVVLIATSFVPIGLIEGCTS